MQLFHNSIRKYTLALLSTFNNLKVQYTLKDGSLETKNIPITFGNKEKSNIFSKKDTELLLSGNTSFLPRATLSISSIVRQEARMTNKFVKIHTKDNEFLFNAMPYEFAFELEIQCRGMNEASMILEQITTKFNPNYVLRINEVPNQLEPTTIPVQLLDVDLQAEEYEDVSMNIVTINAGLSLKGNFYPPIQTSERIKNVDMFINAWHHSEENEYNRAALYNYTLDEDGIIINTNINQLTVDGQFGKIAPVISDIASNGTEIPIDTPFTLEVIYKDLDNKDTELIYVWSSTGSTSITSGNRIAEITGTVNETITVSVIITDVHGNNSGVFSKEYTVV